MSLNELILNQPKPWLPIRIWSAVCDNAFRLISGGAFGFFLVSDANGNGTWQSAGAVIMDTTQVSGSGSGVSYTTSDISGTFLDVDGTNLKRTITIPVGWILLVRCRYYGFRPSAAATNGCGLGLVDTTAARVIDIAWVGSVASFFNGSLEGFITGDGAAHTISLQWANSSGSAGSMLLGNQPINNTPINPTPSPTTTPVIIFQLMHSG